MHQSEKTRKKIIAIKNKLISKGYVPDRWENYTHPDFPQLRYHFKKRVVCFQKLCVGKNYREWKTVRSLPILRTKTD